MHTIGNTASANEIRVEKSRARDSTRWQIGCVLERESGGFSRSLKPFIITVGLKCRLGLQQQACTALADVVVGV